MSNKKSLYFAIVGAGFFLLGLFTMDENSRNLSPFVILGFVFFALAIAKPFYKIIKLLLR